MKRDNRFRIALVVFLLLASVWSLWPTYRVMSMSEEDQRQMAAAQPEDWKKLQERNIKLGLDLSGGMHLVMEIDLDAIPHDARADAQQRFVQIIRNRVDQYGVSEPVIQTQGDDRVVVELAGITDPEQARDLVGRTAELYYKYLQPAEVIADVINRMNRTLYAGLTGGSINRQRIGFDLVQTETMAGAIPGLDTTATDTTRVPDRPLDSYLLQDPRSPEEVFAQENNMAWVDSILALPQIRSLLPSDAEWHWAMWPDERFSGQGVDYRALYLTEKSAIVSGNDLEDSQTTIGAPTDPDAAGQPVVTFDLNSEGAAKIARSTRANIGRRMAVILDDRVAVAPVVREALSGTSRITGVGDMREAQNISIVLRSGALPAPASIVESFTVSATLGADSIRAGTSAALYGLLAVVVFMVVYYRGSGLIADLALFLNVVFILAVLAGFHFTLTLPGIAGIILTMGMAVDANVLIFDRIKEEMRAGKTVRASVEAGFANATSAILDANITTLITGIVLYQFGTGPIRGFALTLCVGIISSVFTALIVTRLVFDGMLNRATTEKLSI